MDQLPYTAWDSKLLVSKILMLVPEEIENNDFMFRAVGDVNNGQ